MIKLHNGRLDILQAVKYVNHKVGGSWPLVESKDWSPISRRVSELTCIRRCKHNCETVMIHLLYISVFGPTSNSTNTILCQCYTHKRGS